MLCSLYKHILYYKLKQCISKSSKRLEMTNCVEKNKYPVLKKIFIYIYIPFLRRTGNQDINLCIIRKQELELLARITMIPLTNVNIKKG